MTWTPPLIRQDRANHYVYGSLAALLGFGVAVAWPGILPSWGGAFLASALAGAIQELRPGGNRSPVDFAWTAAAGLPVAAPAFYLS